MTSQCCICGSNLIADYSKQQGGKRHCDYSCLMILATWACPVMSVLPTVLNQQQCSTLRCRAGLLRPYENIWQQSRISSHVGSKTLLRCSTAESPQKKGMCCCFPTMCHRTLAHGSTKECYQVSLSPKITPQPWLWKICIAKHEPPRARPGR